MRGKSWPEYLAKGRITAAGSDWTLTHLQPHEVTISIPESKGMSAEEVKLNVSYASHCVSYGPKKGAAIDFEICGWDHLIIDHRGVCRAFHPARYALSHQLPQIIATVGARKCLFTNHKNWLTVEGPQLDYPVGSMYEVYFTLKRIEGKKRTLNLLVESAYIRDETAPGPQTKFKKQEKVKGWTLMIKTVRNEPIRSPTFGQIRR
jgi:hypothetical protein